MPSPRRRSRVGALALIPLLLASASAGAEPLTRREAIEASLRSSPDIAGIRHRIEAARADVERVRAGWMPRVAAQGALIMNDKETALEFGNPYAPLAPYLNALSGVAEALNVDFPDPTPLVTAPGTSIVAQNRYDARGSLTATQPIFVPTLRPLSAAATSGVERTEAGLEVIRYMLARGVDGLFTQAVISRQASEIAERSLAVATAQRERARARQSAGAGSALELDLAELGVSRASRELESARAQHLLALEALRTLTGLGGDLEVVDDPTPAVPTGEPQLAARPDVRAAQLGADTELALRQAALRSGLPTVAFQAQVTGTRETDFGGDAVRWNVAVVGTWDLFDGGARYREAEAASRRASAEQENARKVIRDAEAEVRSAEVRIESQRRVVELSQSEREAASRVLERTVLAWQEGAVSGIDVETARQQSAQAHLAAAVSEALYAQALSDLAWARGDLSRLGP